MKVALVHDWLTGMRGGEYVLEAIAELFPRADLFTLIYEQGRVSPVLTTLNRKTSWLQKVPRIERRYRSFLPVMPHAIGRFDMNGYDLIISSSHCVAKGIRKSDDAIHLSYVHAPMRYMWDRFDEYFSPGRSSFLIRTAARMVRKSIQDWDVSVSGENRIDLMIANSHFIAGEIERIYGRKAIVCTSFCRYKTI